MSDFPGQWEVAEADPNLRIVALDIAVRKYEADMTVAASDSKPGSYRLPATTDEFLQYADKVHDWLTQDDGEKS